MRIFFSLLFLSNLTLFADFNWNHSQELNTLIRENSKWVVLGFVADSESTPMIEKRGHTLRKSLEMHIQKKNASILTMSTSERLKWEKMWSLPYKGRYSQNLIKQLAKQENVNILSGSYAPHAPTELTLLAYDIKSDKSSVLYTKQTETTAYNEITQIKKPQIEAESKPKQLTPTQNKTQSFLKKVSSSRKRPFTNVFRNKRMPRSVPRKMKAIEKHLTNSDVMKDFLKSYKDMPNEAIERDANQYIEQAKETYFSSGKVESLCRAYSLSTLINTKQGKKLQDYLLEQIAEHHNFSITTK